MAVNYNTAIVTNGLVLALDAANTKSYPGSGTTWTDLSANGNNGTLVNTPSYSPNNQGYFTFNGTNQAVSSFASTTGFGVTGATPVATMSMWVNFTRRSGQYQQTGFRNDTNTDFYFLLLDNGGATSVPVEARVRTASNAYTITSNTSMDFYQYFQKWMHIVFVVNSTASYLYYNGNLVGSYIGITGNWGATTAFNIAKNYPSSSTTYYMLSLIHI